MTRKFNILFFVVLLAGVELFSQKAQFTASAPSTVQLGQQFQYTIEGNEQGNIKLPAIDDFEVLAGPFTSFSSSTQWVNGRMSVQTNASYTYVFRARKEGDFIIPSALIKVKKEEFKTNEVSIHVAGSGNTAATGTDSPVAGENSQGTRASQSTDESDPVYLRIIPSKRDVYVGEQLVAELKIFTRVNTRPAGGLRDIPYEGFYKHAIDPDQTSSREIINGESYVTQVLQRHVLIPQKSGKMVIEPFESEWTVPQTIQKQRSGSVFDDFFDDPFFNSVRNVPVKLLTKPVTINVKPFPEGAPEGFTGGVGSLNMTVNLSAEQVTENDALSLVIQVSGTGNIGLLGAPNVDFPPDHDVYEPTRSEKIKTTGNKISGSVKFEYPMVARHAGTFRIPPIKFSWFDPVEKKYRTTETDEFIFTVVKGEAGDDSGQVYIPGMRAETVENIGTDILDIQRVSSDFTKIGYSPLGRPWYWIAYLVLVALFLVTGGLLRHYFKQRADIRLVRNRKANKLARSRLKKADKARRSDKTELFFEETEKAIWGYLGDKLGLELSSLSRDKVILILNDTKVSEEDKSELFRIMDDCEFSRYAPSSEKSNVDTLYQDAMKLIKRLEQNIQ